MSDGQDPESRVDPLRRQEPIDADTIGYEQASSDDDSKTWEPNWVATDTRVE